MIGLLLLALSVASQIDAGEEALRFIDGVPIGGPPLVASAMEWTVGHYAGERGNDALFAAGPGKRLDYLVNLAGRGRSVGWADVLELNAKGRVPARVVILSDGDATRRAATVQVLFADGTQSVGAVSFALGIEAASKSFQRRGRADLNPEIFGSMGSIAGFSSSIDVSTTARKIGNASEFHNDYWGAYIHGGKRPGIVAAQLRSQRLMEQLTDSLPADAAWACQVVSGFPVPQDSGTIGFLPFRWSSTTGEREILVQAYTGSADQVEKLHVVTLERRPSELRRRAEVWSWTGAAWSRTEEWSQTSLPTIVQVIAP